MKVTVNHEERNYFNDYDEIRTDEMMFVTSEKVSRVIDKLVRRHKNNNDDVLFITYDDGTGYRLMYDRDGEGGEHLVLRHYSNMKYNSWVSDSVVRPSRAKKLILEGME